MATGLGVVSWMVTTPDGRLFFLENETAVRVVEDDTLVPRPALLIDGSEAAIVGMAVDPAFARTRTVYVAISERRADGSRALSVSRFREVGNAFGQAATIVRNLPVPEAALAPLAVDAEGYVYLALPAIEGAPAASSDVAYNSFVLRFAPDGTVPSTNPRPSPIFAVGFARPTALAIDDESRRAWMAGTDPSWDRPVVAFPIDPREHAEWPQRPEAGLQRTSDSPERAATTLSIVPRSDGTPVILSLVADGEIRQAQLAGGAAGPLHTIDTRALGPVSAVATVPGGDSYVAIGGPWSTIVRLAGR